MKCVYIILVCFIALTIPNWKVSAEDTFPEFRSSDIRLYVPIEKIIHAYQADLEHEVGFNFSYNVHGQPFTESGKGHIQTLAEGFSGTSDKSTPWKILTELLVAYHHTDIEVVKSLYTSDSQEYINQLLSDPNVKERFINYMKAVKGMDVVLGFDHKNGFIAFVNLDYSESAEHRYGLTPFFFVLSGAEYLLSRVTLNEPITANISTYLQVEPDVAKLLVHCFISF
jgi:hypothetical protein